MKKSTAVKFTAFIISITTPLLSHALYIGGSFGRAQLDQSTYLDLRFPGLNNTIALREADETTHSVNIAYTLFLGQKLYTFKKIHINIESGFTKDFTSGKATAPIILASTPDPFPMDLNRDATFYMPYDLLSL